MEKTAVLDGFPYKFYEVFKEIQRAIFWATFSMAFECGDESRHLAQFWLRLYISSILSFICKGISKRLKSIFRITENHNWINFVKRDYLIIKNIIYGFLILIRVSNKDH